MRKLVAALTLSTLALAITCVYLWTELREARQDAAESRPTLVAEPSVPSQPTIEANGPARTTGAPAKGDSKGAGIIDDRQRILEEDMQQSARRNLAQLSDPSMRAQMLEEWKEANLPKKKLYARYLGISEADAERLIDVLAERNLVQSEAYSRCLLKPPCDFQSISRQMRAAEEQAVTDLLGPEKQQQFEEYTYSSLERGLIASFLNQKLPAGNQLSEEQSERLVAALAEERKLVDAEIRQRGIEPFSFPMEGMAFTFPASLFESGRSEDRLREAAEFNQRMHARARVTLNAQQLAAFEEMQEAGIVGLKFWLRKQERDRATQATPAAQSR